MHRLAEERALLCRRGSGGVGYLRDAAEVIVAITEQCLEYADALEVEADIEFIGDADAAVHLHRLVADPVGHSAHLPFCQAHPLRGLFVVAVDGVQCRHQAAACQFQFHMGPSGAVLQCLEGADGGIELDQRFGEAVKNFVAPLGRAGQPDEIAAGVEFLLSEQARFINGTVLLSMVAWMR